MMAIEEKEIGANKIIEEGKDWEKSKWEIVMELVQTDFQDGVITEEATCQAMILIPKGGGDYRGIGIVEVVWKAVAVILNRRFTASIT